jgi:hypothetical protein
MGANAAVASAGWVTATDAPAIVMVALRVVPELFGKTARAKEAEAAPVDAAETVIQPGKPEIAQGQDAAVWMPMATVPPEAGACSVVGETE